jgi:L-lactate dehydrogenase complex protein LldG
VSEAREAVLARVRAALRDVADSEPTEAPRSYNRSSDLSRDDVVRLFAERAADYRANVRRAVPGEVAETVATVLAEHGAGRVAVPVDLPAEWRPRAAELIEDAGLPARELDELDGAVTGCALAVAETGTLVLDGGPGQGRRALTLVPDLHVCVVLEQDIVATVPEAVAALEPGVRRDGRPVTFVSGPSATSDIELSRVEGVHGPRRLEIVIMARP